MKKRLIHGDCLIEMQFIKENFVDLVLADPPYGTTNCKWDSIIPLGPLWNCLKRVVKPKAAIVMTGSQPFTTVLIHSNLDWFKYCWVWEKENATNFQLAHKMPLKIHEDIMVFNAGVYYPQETRACMKVNKNSDVRKLKHINTKKDFYEQTMTNYPISIKYFPRDNDKIHPTQKPVALMEYLIKTYTKEGQTVLDFCMGSGTTGVACARLNRNFIGIEKDDEYFRIAKERINKAIKDDAQGFFKGSNLRNA